MEFKFVPGLPKKYGKHLFVLTNEEIETGYYDHKYGKHKTSITILNEEGEEADINADEKTIKGYLVAVT